MYQPLVSADSSATATKNPFPGKGTAMFDTVKVSDDTFVALMFMSSTERTEWNDDRNAPKQQKRTAQGVPVWSVQVAATNWREQSAMLAVTVASRENPAESISRGEEIRFDGLVYGVTPKRNGGFTIWTSAESVTAASASGARPLEVAK